MKKLLFASLFIILFFSCKKENNGIISSSNKKIEFATFGDSITAEGAITKEELLEKFNTLKEKDTIEIKVASTIEDVCQKKGCWMNLDLGNNQVAFTNYNYDFLMPLNSAKSNVIVNGKAFIEVVSVNQLKHYAKDAGKSEAAIDSITEPEKTFCILANGVLLEKK